MQVLQGEIAIRVGSSEGIICARRQARSFAMAMGFKGAHLTMIATATSELARNIVAYAGAGEIVLCEQRQERRIGFTIVAIDHGPGITNHQNVLPAARQLKARSIHGLDAVRRAMDESEILSNAAGPKTGTRVTATKWLS
jgi:serine/threonine-protein kinase RsbT